MGYVTSIFQQNHDLRDELIWLGIDQEFCQAVLVL